MIKNACFPVMECNDGGGNKVAQYQICDGNMDCPNNADEFVTLAGKVYQNIKFVPYITSFEHDVYFLNPFRMNAFFFI